ncbi:MAG: winged helix DNA-binding domain-containing protein [Candidatus Pacebacteria bacterium]|nr:winged helix DNA-binding domain-containing protein [Candidatus Paceibacterota bacterium]
MDTVSLTKIQARNFLLLKHGLIGKYLFKGKNGVCDFIHQAGCIQFDPIDVCGKNAELVLQSRVSDFKKSMLHSLLYEERKLIDYFDKNMSIFHLDDWKYFSRFRNYYNLHGKSLDEVNAAEEEVKQIIKENKFISSRDLPLDKAVDWSWNPTSLSRAVLETLYFRGDLIIHHKKGTIKYYSLAEDFIDSKILNSGDPNETEEDFLKWQVLRRIGSVGLLMNKPSHAWLGIENFNKETRNLLFPLLLKEDKILQCTVEGITDKLYCLYEDAPLIKIVLEKSSFQGRLEFLAPLDNLLWDRNLIRAIFDFDYKWEIYTPITQRKYGYYVLPVLYKNRFVGRTEFGLNKKEKKLCLLNFWKEDGVKLNSEFYRDLQKRVAKFSEFNNCLSYEIQL